MPFCSMKRGLISLGDLSRENHVSQTDIHVSPHELIHDFKVRTDYLLNRLKAENVLFYLLHIPNSLITVFSLFVCVFISFLISGIEIFLIDDLVLKDNDCYSSGSLLVSLYNYFMLIT